MPEEKPFEFRLTSRAMAEGMQTSTAGSGQPKSSQEFQEAMVNLAARPVATLYESWLLASGRENNVETRALFFADHMPAIMRAFLGMSESWQFQKNLSDRRGALKKAAQEKLGDDQAA